MKFGKYIQTQQAEWAGTHFLNYKALKKIITVAVSTSDSSDHADRRPGESLAFSTVAAPDLPDGEPILVSVTAEGWRDRRGGDSGNGSGRENPEFVAHKTEFFFRLDREVEKVNAFYLQKENEFKVRLRSLIDKKRVLLSRPSWNKHASAHSLREGFLQFQQDLAKLQKFVEVNGTGFRKILKKWDKRSKSATKDMYLSRQVEIQPCFNKEVLAELNDVSSTHIAELDAVITTLEPESSSATAPAPAFVGGLAGERYLDDVETELMQLYLNNEIVAAAELLERRKSSAVDGNTSLFAEDKEILSRVFLRVIPDGAIDALQALTATGWVDPNYADDVSDRTSLHEAAAHGRLDALKLCVANNGKFDAVDVYGRKPLHYAAMYGAHGCTTYLVSLGSDLNAVDHDGSTPLVYSIINGHASCAETFLASGARIEPDSATSLIPISLACQYGHRDIATMLLSRGATLLPNAEGLFPLHLAAREGHYEVAKLLIENGAEVNREDVINGWTALFFAASEGHVEVVKALVGAGARFNRPDEIGWVPKTYALHRGHVDVANLLGDDDDEEMEEEGSAGSSAVAGVPVPIEKQMVGTVEERNGSENVKPMAPSALFVAGSGNNHQDGSFPSELDLDSIPSLSLPPPIIPFRIYGHNYLENKCNLQITLTHLAAPTATASAPTPGLPIHLFNSRQLSSLKLVISTSPEINVPYSVILPPKDDLETYTFLVDEQDLIGILNAPSPSRTTPRGSNPKETTDGQQFSLQFEIYPTFGTRPIARTSVLASQLLAIAGSNVTGAVEMTPCIQPLYDSHVRVVGEMVFGFSIVKPFVHRGLRIGGSVETYWKTTKVVNSGPAAPPSNSAGLLSALGTSGVFGTPCETGGPPTQRVPAVQSFITASSLAEEYIQLVVQVTKDGVPVVYPHWFLPVPGVKDRDAMAVDEEEEGVDDVEGKNVYGIRIGVAGVTFEQGKWITETSGYTTRLVGEKSEDGETGRKYDSGGNNGQGATGMFVLFGGSASTSTTGTAARSQEWAKIVGGAFVSLEDVLQGLPMSVGVSIELKYPTQAERAHFDLVSLPDINTFVDAVLRVVYDRSEMQAQQPSPGKADGPQGERTQRSIIFSSFNPSVCMAINWKQPNYGVFFGSRCGYAAVSGGSTMMTPRRRRKRLDGEGAERVETDRRCLSIKEAVRFARSSNLLGVVCDARPLIHVPMLINTIKESGLILATFGKANTKRANVDVQERAGVDAIISDGIFRYNTTS
ncbi:hypothetical protein BJ742DRAFT_807702 [Cladochytrium replicatum]|nr:hypothetical protein BJ742DRAFT_807702 [Cladochytrium replicatum]